MTTMFMTKCHAGLETHFKSGDLVPSYPVRWFYLNMILLPIYLAFVSSASSFTSTSTEVSSLETRFTVTSSFQTRSENTLEDAFTPPLQYSYVRLRSMLQCRHACKPPNCKAFWYDAQSSTCQLGTCQDGAESRKFFHKIRRFFPKSWLCQPFNKKGFK